MTGYTLIRIIYDTGPTNPRVIVTHAPPPVSATDHGTNRKLATPICRGKHPLFICTFLSTFLHYLLSRISPYISKYHKTSRKESTPHIKAKFFYAIAHKPEGIINKLIFVDFASKKTCK